MWYNKVMANNIVQQLVLSSAYTADLDFWFLCVLVCLFNINVDIGITKI